MIHDLTASLDLKQNLNIYATCKQSDNLNLILTVYDNSVQADLTNYNVRLKAMKADLVPLIQDTEYSVVNNVVTIIAHEQLTTTSGKTLIELQFINKTTGLKKATFNLVLNVVASTLEVNATISTATYTLLQELENKLDQATDYLESIDAWATAHPDIINLETNLIELEAEVVLKADNTDNTRTTLNKTVTGAINEINANKTLESKTSFLYERALKEIGIIPLDSLKNAIKAIVNTNTLRIAIVGDSITERADLNNIDDSYAMRLYSQIKKALPTVNIVYQNFALGARYLALFNNASYLATATEPTTDISTGFYRSWSTVGKSWKNHVKDFAPDLFIVAFGMNDAFGNSPTIDYEFANGLNTVITDANTWSSNPSVVLVSTILPTTNTSLYSQSQKITNAVARATRMFAKENSLAIADSNRLFQILRDGKDDTTRASKKETNWGSYPIDWSGNTGNYTLNNNTMTVNGGGTIYNDKTFYNGTIEVTINPAQVGDNGVTEIAYRYDSNYGNFLVFVGAGNTTGYLRLYSVDSGVPTLLQEVTGLTIPINTTSIIKIKAEDNEHYVYLNGIQGIYQKTYRNMHDGKISMASKISPYATFSNLTINFKNVAYGNPIYTEAELLGTNTSPYDEGNGINHPSPLGHALTYLSSFAGIINGLTNKKEIGVFMPQRILSTAFANPDGSYTTPSGRQLWYKFITAPVYNKNRGIKLVRRDTGAEYTLSTTAITQATTNTLGVNDFAYFSVGPNDILIVNTATGTPLTWDFDLYRFE